MDWLTPLRRGPTFCLQPNQFFISVKVFISLQHTCFKQSTSVFVMNLLIRVNLTEVELGLLNEQTNDEDKSLF